MRAIFFFALVLAVVGNLRGTRRTKHRHPLHIFNTLTGRILAAANPVLHTWGRAKSDDPDMFKNVTELVSSKGYPVENHIVETQDGYFLQMQRIPYGRNGARQDNKPVAFIMHGIFSSSNDWTINFPEQTLSFILADAGYDLWMGNARGNTYSKKNKYYTTDMPEFWNFSFDEHAKYDIPAMIDYILKETGQEKLFYLGHSQGTTSAFAMLSERQEYNEKIKLLIAMAPIISLAHTKGPLRLLGPLSQEGEISTSLLGEKEFLPNDGVMKYVSQYVCDTDIRFLCESVIFLLFGADPELLNTTRLGVYSAHTPAGTSTKAFLHLNQLGSGKFRKYDYGSDNMLHYNQTTPPEYDVSKTTTPVALMWGENDFLADPEDVSILRNKLKKTTVVQDYKVPFPPFNHLDFCWALHAKELLYDRILQLLYQYR